MTDARLRGEWLTAAAHDALSDPAYRVLHNALMHSAEQGTDGAIDRRELRFLYPGPLEAAWLDELEEAGFWEKTDAGYQFIDWTGKLGQSTKATVDATREANRLRQARRRANEKAALAADKTPGETDTASADSGRPTAPPSHRESRRDVTVRVGRTGQDRQAGRSLPVLQENACARGHDFDPISGWCSRCETRDIPVQLEASA